MPLQVDANQAYTRARIDHLCGLDEFDLLLIEQPIHEEDYLGHKLLAERMRRRSASTSRSCRPTTPRASSTTAPARSSTSRPDASAATSRRKAIHDMASSRIPVWCGGMVETGLGRAANVALASLPGFTLPGDTSASSASTPST